MQSTGDAGIDQLHLQPPCACAPGPPLLARHPQHPCPLQRLGAAACCLPAGPRRPPWRGPAGAGLTRRRRSQQGASAMPFCPCLQRLHCAVCPATVQSPFWPPAGWLDWCLRLRQRMKLRRAASLQAARSLPPCAWLPCRRRQRLPCRLPPAAGCPRRPLASAWRPCRRCRLTAPLLPPCQLPSALRLSRQQETWQATVQMSCQASCRQAPRQAYRWRLAVMPSAPQGTHPRGSLGSHRRRQ